MKDVQSYLNTGSIHRSSSANEQANLEDIRQLNSLAGSSNEQFVNRVFGELELIDLDKLRDDSREIKPVINRGGAGGGGGVGDQGGARAAGGAGGAGGPLGPGGPAPKLEDSLDGRRTVIPNGNADFGTSGLKYLMPWWRL